MGGQQWNESMLGAQTEPTYFFSCVFLRMKVTSFLTSKMKMRSPMTPPTTARMMSVTVLSTSSTARPEGEQGSRGHRGRAARPAALHLGHVAPGAWLSPRPTAGGRAGLWPHQATGRALPSPPHPPTGPTQVLNNSDAGPPNFPMRSHRLCGLLPVQKPLGLSLCPAVLGRLEAVRI